MSNETKTASTNPDLKINFMLSTSNKREEQILFTALSQRGIKVFLFAPEFRFYTKMLQYKPDIIIIEFPYLHIDQLRFLKLIKKHRMLKNLPILGYGNKIDNDVKQGLNHFGLTNYFVRPLSFSSLITSTEEHLKTK